MREEGGAAADEIRDLRAWKRRLSLVLDFAKRAASVREVDALLALLVEEACAILEAERGTIFLLDRAADELWSRASSGGDEIRVPAGVGIVGESVRSARVVNIPDAYADPRFNAAVDRATGFRTRSLLTAPMRTLKGEVVGALQVLNARGGAFGADDEEMLLLVAEQAAAAVENARLYDHLRSAAQDTIFRLAAAAEFKDKDTASHLERMSRYCTIIAEEMGLPEETCRTLTLASPMHDIGKLGVPDAVLMKPGKLDEREWSEIRRHPTYGGEILKGSENELIRMSERVARSHHEKVDGTGYPAGLRGDEIPLEGRIVALADVFDALTSRRCYKPAFSLDETLRIIREGAGRHFDPAVAEAFFRALPRICEVMSRFADRPGDAAERPEI